MDMYKEPATSVATATEMQNNFGRYADMVANGEVVVVTRNGKEIGRFIPRDYHIRFLSERLRGIAKGEDYDEIKDREMRQKYEIDD